MEQETVEKKKTQSLKNFVESIAEIGDVKAIKDIFERVPIEEVRNACLKKIVPESAETMVWLIQKTDDFIQIGDFQTALLMLKKIAQFKTEDVANRDYIFIFLVLQKWIEEDRRAALKDGLEIIYEKIKKENLYFQAETRNLFCLILEKYDNDNIERSAEDFEMLQHLIGFISRLGEEKNYYIPLFKKNQMPWSEIKKLSSGVERMNFRRAIFEIDRGLITGDIKPG